MTPESLATAKVIIYVIVVVLFFSLETLAPFRELPESRFRHISRNLILSLVNTIIIAGVFGTGIALLTLYTAEHNIGLFHTFDLGFWPELIVSFLVLDLVIYIWHRLIHRVNFLWRFHMVHHVDLPIDFSSAARFHPGEIVGSLIFHGAMYFALGMSLEMILTYQVIMTFFTHFAHVNYRLPKEVDDILRLIFVTPNFHQVHHSVLPKDFNSNFSTIFSFWDRMFGSYENRRDLEEVTLGLPCFDKPTGFFRALRLPFVKNPFMPEDNDCEDEEMKNMTEE